MVGQGVLREGLLDPDVRRVLAIGRTATRQQDAKLREIVRNDFLDYADIEDQLTGFDACFFCLGVSSLGMSEDQYRRITYDFTIAAARTLARLNPGMTFIFVSGAGTDSTGRSRNMWARVKGAAEKEVQKLPFRAVYVFRPGMIIPRYGVKSRTRIYRALYGFLGPMLPLLKRAFPDQVTTTEQIGRAMLRAAKTGAPKAILGTREINSL